MVLPKPILGIVKQAQDLDVQGSKAVEKAKEYLAECFLSGVSPRAVLKMAFLKAIIFSLIAGFQGKGGGLGDRVDKLIVFGEIIELGGILWTQVHGAFLLFLSAIFLFAFPLGA